MEAGDSSDGAGAMVCEEQLHLGEARSAGSPARPPGAQSQVTSAHTKDISLGFFGWGG